MITDSIDDRTLANMEVALERACVQLPPAFNNHTARRAIASKILHAVRNGNKSLAQLTATGQAALNDFCSKHEIHLKQTA